MSAGLVILAVIALAIVGFFCWEVSGPQRS